MEEVRPLRQRVDGVGRRRSDRDQLTGEERRRLGVLAVEDHDVVLDPGLLVVEVDRDRLLGRHGELVRARSPSAEAPSGAASVTTGPSVRPSPSSPAVATMSASPPDQHRDAGDAADHGEERGRPPPADARRRTSPGRPPRRPRCTPATVAAVDVMLSRIRENPNSTRRDDHEDPERHQDRQEQALSVLASAHRLNSAPISRLDVLMTSVRVQPVTLLLVVPAEEDRGDDHPQQQPAERAS